MCSIKSLATIGDRSGTNSDPFPQNAAFVPSLLPGAIAIKKSSRGDPPNSASPRIQEDSM
jgi:hypothetical protein